MITPDQIRRMLGLAPHPTGGGYFAKTYRAAERLPGAALPGRYRGNRSLSTAIDYLLTPDTVSALHPLRSEEVFHFYLEDPVEILQLEAGGPGRVLTLGTDLGARMRPQIVVPAGVWQGARLRAGGRPALLGTTVGRASSSPTTRPADGSCSAPIRSSRS